MDSEVPGADVKSFSRRGTGTRIIGQSFEYFKLIFTAETDTDASQSKRAYLGFHANYEYVPREFHFTIVTLVIVFCVGL